MGWGWYVHLYGYARFTDMLDYRFVLIVQICIRCLHGISDNPGYSIVCLIVLTSLRFSTSLSFFSFFSFFSSSLSSFSFFLFFSSFLLFLLFLLFLPFLPFPLLLPHAWLYNSLQSMPLSMFKNPPSPKSPNSNILIRRSGRWSGPSSMISSRLGNNCSGVNVR